MLQVKLWSLVGVEDASCSVSDLECQEELMSLKANMMKAHTYSQGMPSSLQSWLLRYCVSVPREQGEAVLSAVG